MELNSLKIKEEIIDDKLKIFNLKNIKDQMVRNLSHGQKKSFFVKTSFQTQNYGYWMSSKLVWIRTHITFLREYY